MNFLKNVSGFLRYRFKLYLSILKCSISGGSFVYSITPKVKFVCTQQDSFSKVIYISNGHEKLEMEWCRVFLKNAKAKMIFDCGANIGYFSSYLAQTNPTYSFIAIEGNEKTFKILQNNTRKLNLPTITCIHSILGENLEESFEIPDTPGREPWQQAKVTSHSTVKTLTLDFLTETYQLPDLVKIDCEGFEVKILKGAISLLSHSHCVFMVECNDEALHHADTSREELFKLFQQHHYRLIHLSSFGKAMAPGLELTKDFPSTEFNFVAFPDKPYFINLIENSIKDLKAVFP